MKIETAAKFKYGIWGLIGGAAVAMIVGFGWGGWTTASTAQAMSDKAVVASQAAICVAQFVRQPDHEKRLEEFAGVSDWTRGDFIEKGGWNRMPGQEGVHAGVAEACAEGLARLARE